MPGAIATRGRWPPNIPDAAKRAYNLAEIKQWLRVFLYRFFELSQFKRSALPNGPKISSGGSLSPRGDWRAPSDATAKVWLEELEAARSGQRMNAAQSGPSSRQNPNRKTRRLPRREPGLPLNFR